MSTLSFACDTQVDYVVTLHKSAWLEFLKGDPVPSTRELKRMLAEHIADMMVEDSGGGDLRIEPLIVDIEEVHMHKL